MTNKKDLKHFSSHLRALLDDKVFIFITLSLTSLYFVITGINFWMTSYFIKVIGATRHQVVITFSICCITAPIMGVLVGGCIVDRFGG